MHLRHHWSRLMVAATAGVVLLASCGGGDDTAEADVEDVSLEQQLGIDDEGIADRQLEAENLIRDCMEAEGFDYVPVDPAAQQAELTGTPGMSKEDFEKEFGYGITTLYEQRVDQAVAGPNEEIRAELSPEDQAAYDRALYGDDASATFAQALDTGDYSRLGGCTKDATEEVFGGAEILQTLSSRLDELDDRMLADARMVKAVKKWTDCMEAEGFDGLDEPEEVDEVLLREFNTLVGPPDERYEEYDADALRDLQRKEVEMVTADIMCEKRHIEAVEEEVAAEYEEKFRERNASLLSKVKGQG